MTMARFFTGRVEQARQSRCFDASDDPVIAHLCRLWVHDYNFYLDFLAKNKFNAIRVLLALDTVMSAWHPLQAGTSSTVSPTTLPLLQMTPKSMASISGRARTTAPAISTWRA